MKNTMRYFSLAVLFVAVAALTGCEKEETAGNAVSGTYTASVKMADNGSKALTEGGVKTFAVGDQIAVIYKNTSNETVKAVSEALTAGDIAAGNKRANFKVTLTNPDNTKAITYIYPAAMANNDGTVDYSQLDIQDGTIGSLAALDACMYTAASWGGENLPADVSLTNVLAICKFTVKESVGSTDITSTVTRLTVKNGSDIYTVNSSSLSTIWVAMKPVTTGDITVYAAKGKELYKKTVSSPTLDAGKLYPVNVTTTKVDGAISGVFSVSSTKQVYFSQGNLQAVCASADNDGNTQETWSWQFATNQWDYIGNAAANTSIDGNGSVSTEGTVDLFGWSTNNSTYYGIHNSTSRTNDYMGDFVDWGKAMGGDWCTLTRDEWYYLFFTRTTPSGVRYAKATVNSNPGVILLPDDWNTSYHSLNSTNSTSASYTSNDISSTEWTNDFEAHGAVFLPAAGHRHGSEVSNTGENGNYWSATHYGGDSAKYLTIIGNILGLVDEGYRDYSRSVRLVHNL